MIWHGRAIVAVSTMFLVAALVPWARSGSRGRSPFALRDSAVALDLYDGWFGAAVEIAWVLVPILVGAIWVLSSFSLYPLMRILGGVVAAIGVATAWAIWRSPLVRLGGLTVGLSLAVVLLALVCVPTASFHHEESQ